MRTPQSPNSIRRTALGAQSKPQISDTITTSTTSQGVGGDKGNGEPEIRLASAHSPDPEVRKRNLFQQRAFKFSHSLLVLLLLFFVFLHGVGLFLFTKGFLLTRLVLGEKSSCAVSPLGSAVDWEGGDIAKGCWHPKTFDKAVVIVIDALRYDFTVPFGSGEDGDSMDVGQFHNAFTTPHALASKHPRNAILLPFIADPPTTTLQRLKGLTTGTLPTFVDVGSNFAGHVIDEDNLISQLKAAGKRTAFMGDDTWMALFPGLFEKDMEYPFESLNVWDLHTLDNGVNEHIFPLLHPENASRWDVLIGHYLGVDHAGHRYGPDHFAMRDKLVQMNGVIEKLVGSIDDDTLLVVMGDHGMDSKGDHGGESQSELEAALWMYSRKPVFGEFPQGLDPNGGDYSGPPGARSVAQIDLVPTLSLLLGLPIPFNNLGAPIVEVFYGEGGVPGWKNLVDVSHLTAAQIKRYRAEYSGKNGVKVEGIEGIDSIWDTAYRKLSEVQKLGRNARVVDWQNVFIEFSSYQSETLRACRRAWARFDLVNMAAGITVLVGSVAVVGVYARAFTGDHTELTDTLLTRMAKGLGAGAVLSVADGAVAGMGQFGVSSIGQSLGLSSLRMLLLTGSLGTIIGFFSATHYARRRLASLLPNSGWGALCLVFTLTHSLIFGSNSFTIWEDKILTFFLGTFGFVALLSSQRLDTVKRALGTYHSIVFLLLVRLSSISRLCREEQMPSCESTFYSSSSSSVSAPRTLIVLFIMALGLPSIISSYYRHTNSYSGPAPAYIGFGFRLGLLLSALYWALDSADNGDWIPDLPEGVLKPLKNTVSQIVLAMGLLAGNLVYAYSSVCVAVRFEYPLANQPTTSSDGDGEDIVPPSQSLKPIARIVGTSNLHGSRYFMLLLSWSLALILLQKPMGGASMGLLLWQILSLLELLHTLSLSDSAIGPVILGILGNSHFFSTGHQAALSAIQWESAFIPFSTIRYPWSPMLVIANSIGPQLLTALAVPLVVLWKAPPTGTETLGKTAKAVATHTLYHSAITLSAVACAGHLRRHMMLYRIFGPRYMLGGVVLLAVDAMVLLVVMWGTRVSFLSVGGLFGY
ncbi:unnamed protein product [Tuber melanosporum]|uniref:(Perigord truffle) hypothetical protein n=1 Tax=Tuber melanosporum (strain Mel28) TaxID=656061 RepID=D5GMD7_TUBMM|nr:uncharacterized protein GSTUM_00010662001 [Tuber melanosporum]CAZ85680.1 unnamed protein product [Tuber melanosporum]